MRKIAIRCRFDVGGVGWGPAAVVSVERREVGRMAWWSGLQAQCKDLPAVLLASSRSQSGTVAV